jgi:hypothetical protein
MLTASGAVPGVIALCCPILYNGIQSSPKLQMAIMPMKSIQLGGVFGKSGALLKRRVGLLLS